MSDDLERKNIQVRLDVHEALTNLKRGNMTYSDVISELLKKTPPK
jgi:predicted CopG family antitoxin